MRVDTFDGVGLGELGEVHDELLGEGVPFLVVAHPQVDVCAGELIDVKLSRPSAHAESKVRFVRRHTLDMS